MTRKDVIDLRNAKLAASLIKAFESRHFEAQYCPGMKEALEAGLGLIPQNHSVGWGGTMTVDELGLKEALRKRGTKVIDRDRAKTPEERVEIMKQAILSDTFLMSANAISESGCLVNIDGNGNRLAALLYGPKQVLVFAGLNKVVKTVDDAVVRARTVASPLNVTRLADPSAPQDQITPCQASGVCGNCKSLGSACSQIVITRLCKPAGRIKIILIGEDCGL
jgi:L-lactate utilization protein LutB